MPKGARIIRHRVGYAYDVLSRMNYYEAEYALPDELTEINHAEGPLPLFTKRIAVIIAVSLASLLLAAGFFLLATRPKFRAT